MKLGLGKIKEALRSGTAKDTGEGKKEQIGGRRQADKEETQKMVNSEKDSGSLEEVKMKLKRTEQEPQSGSLSPADRTKAEKTGLIFFPLSIWPFPQRIRKEKSASSIQETRSLKKALWICLK